MFFLKKNWSLFLTPLHFLLFGGRLRVTFEPFLCVRSVKCPDQRPFWVPAERWDRSDETLIRKPVVKKYLTSKRPLSKVIPKQELLEKCSTLHMDRLAIVCKIRPQMNFKLVLILSLTLTKVSVLKSHM
jgi:hypothetical protein